MTTTTVQKGKIISISVAHMLNDWYMNFIQTLLPFIVASGFGVGKSAFLISAFTTTSSILQPVFGYLVDQRNQRWMVYVGTIWMAVLLSLIGLTDNYYLLLLLTALSGLGTAAFHPQASAMISAVSGQKKGFSQAIFTAGGNIGWALTPLLVIPVVSNYGLRITPLFVIPGILVAILLWFTAPKTSAMKKAETATILTALRGRWLELAKVVMVIACRSLAYFGLIAFLPLYLTTKNISIVDSSHFIFIMLFTGAIGGIFGGLLSDKWGRKAVIVSSLVLATPFFWLFLYSGGIVKYLFLAFAGANLLASFSVTVVMAQEIISKNAAMASGLTLGFGIGMGGLGVGLVGVIIEHIGLNFAINMLVWFPLFAGLLALSLKEKATSVLVQQESVK
ncbi:MAG: major facilitator superfamily 1 [Firmicutes bacterium]|nr:major facilitator superfamily 1 [Bacillota bacterium]